MDLKVRPIKMRMLWLAVLLIWLSASAFPVQAQTVDSETETEQAELERDDAVELEGIVVQGQKLVRRAMDTYSSISVITGEELEALGASDFRDALRLVPNASFSPSERGNNGFTLRGINSEGVTGPANVTRPLASFVLDGITQSFEGARRGARGIYDVDQIEVARGPQSTLLGRNALAGALLVNTRNPTFNWEGSARIGFGTLGYREQAAMLSGPIGDPDTASNAFRVVAHRFESDKGYDIQTPDLDTSIDEDEYEAVRAKWLFDPIDSPFSALFTASYVNDRPSQTGVQGPDFFEREIFVPLSSYEFRESEVENYIADLGYEFTNGWQLRSITGFTRTDLSIETPEASALFRDEFRVDEDLTQEVRLQYDRGDGLSALFGVFAASLENERDSVVLIDPPGFVIQDLESNTRLDNYAIFGELRYPLTDRLTAIAGLRYDYEDYAVDFLDRNEDPPALTPVDNSYDALLPKLGLAWAFVDNQRLALTVSRGYRGGYVETVVSTGERNPIDPEFLTAYELAWRAELLDDQLFLSTNLFYYDWTDQQISVIDPNDPLGLFTITSNAGESNARGVELELRWQMSDQLQLLLGAGLLETEFDQFDSPSGDFAGFEFPEAPRKNGTLALLWNSPGGWFANADISYTDSYYTTGRVGNRDIPLFNQFLISGFTVINASGGYERDNWRVRAFVRNVADRDYLTAIAFNGNEGFVGDERAFGLELDLRFSGLR